MGILENKVAVVTGAGRGIGQEIAMIMAAEGAKVVVNDVGCSDTGLGHETKVADEVAELINGAGGEAVANYDSVATYENGQNIIQTALDNFGKIDILVNNAGILRDRMIFKMSEEEWDSVIDVHLKGHFCCTRAATPIMREQKSGAIINFTSTSGLIGNVGQANYGAAKMGIVGFTRNVALDMRKYGVRVNAIAPFAWTRLIGTIPTETEEQKKRVEKVKKMRPADVATFTAFLASDGATDITGQVFGVRGKEIYLFSMPRIVRSIHHSEGWDFDKLKDMLCPTMKSYFTPLETSAQNISWEPLV